jgi:TM2 domain-containing membrane protein YozV
MYCSYHTASTARVQCSSCSRGLCSACDHRIKGYPYCQDCIVLGVEGLSRNHYAPRPRGSARFAALLALLPGMGAVYNRQNIKGIVHFVTIVGLFQLTGIRIAPAFFVLGGLSFYIYSIVDAYRTAQLIAQGEDPAVDEARFKRSLIKRAPLIGVILITVGLLFVIQMARPYFPLATLVRFLPVALIILGGYLLTRYFKRPREESYEEHPTSTPYSLVPGNFSNRTSEHNSRERSDRLRHSAGRR